MEKASVKWTPMQSAAIDIRDRTLLVSAAAGSGKTAVLTERIIRRLCDSENPADISRMLVVTYTKAAANELKSRISKAIGKAIAQDPSNRHLKRQLLLLPSAKISTIHSFCFDVIKKNLRTLGLPDGITVSSGPEMTLLSREIMSEIIDSGYRGELDSSLDAESFAKLSDLFSHNGTDSAMCDTLIDIYTKLVSYPEGIEFLKISAERLISESDGSFYNSLHARIIADRLFSSCKYLLHGYRSVLDDIKADEVVFEKYGPTAFDEASVLESLTDKLERGLFSAAQKTVLAHTFPKLASLSSKYATEYSQRYKDLRDEFKAVYKDELLPFFERDESELTSMAKSSAELILVLYRVLSAFDKAFKAEKNKIAKVNFNDLERYAYELLVQNGRPSETALELSHTYDEIYIDEYQDTNSLQDAIFASLARPDNRFMVGDIKQSIYSFRGAAPENFSRYRDTFTLYDPENDIGASENTIFLSNNFRCDSTVVDFCNTVFSRIFRNASGRVPYYDSDDLVCSKSDGDTLTSPVKIVLAQKPDDTDADTLSEAEYIALEARRLIDSEKKKDGSLITASDIAVLARTKASSAAIEKALNRVGIMTSNNIETEFFENSEILLVMSLLNVIDNPMRDIYLAGVLRSPLFSFTLDELVRIRAFDRSGSLYEALVSYTEANGFEKGRVFLEKLAYFRTLASGTQVDRLIRKLYRECSLFAIVSADSKPGTPPEEARENLMLLYSYAREFEGSSFKGLSNFIKYVDDIIAQKTKLAGATAKAPAGDTVRIMTIHHSKGLEFPVVFVAAAGKLTDARDKIPPVLIDRHAGVSIDLPGIFPGTKIKTLHRHAIEIRMDEERAEEEMRVLYVALTRARERLYISAEYTDVSKEYDKAKALADNFCSQTVMKHHSYMRLTLASVINAGYESEEKCVIITPKAEDFAESADTAALDVTYDSALADGILENIRSGLDFVYPHKAALGIPSKLSVSSLHDGVLDRELGAVADGDGVKPLSERLSEIKPAFIAGKTSPTAADRGTATHIFMQFCDFESAETKGVAYEIERMLALGFITPETAELIDKKRAEAFFESSLYKDRLKGAGALWREYRFNVSLPASDFTSIPEKREALRDEVIFVQGIIDCFIENADGTYTLIDYKTDRIPFDFDGGEDEFTRLLAKRHASQLTYYKRALEIITKKPVREVLIYSFALGKAVDITKLCNTERS